MSIMTAHETLSYQADSNNRPAAAAPATASPLLQYHCCNSWPELGYFLVEPPRVTADTPLFVSVHGISRNAREHAETFGHLCQKIGWLLVAPRFSQATFPHYQQLGYRRRQQGPRADLALTGIIDEVQQRLGLSRQQVMLFGYSGGAQFAHRYALLHPQRVAAAALGSAGWYSFPDPLLAYPRGMRTPRQKSDLRPQLERLLTIPMALFIGSQDAVRDPALNTRRSIDRQQGRNRVERGQRWLDAMRVACRRRGLQTHYQMELLEGCGHSFQQCVSLGQLDLRVLKFFRQIVEAQITSQ